MERRVLAIALLTIASMVAVAQEKVERIEFSGGSVKTFTNNDRRVDELNKTASKAVRTVVYDNNNNLPLAGGVITNYSSDIVVKLLIVSVSPNDLTVRKDYPLTDPYYYAKTEDNKWEISVYRPCDYRIIDCTNINRDQFFCYLMALQPMKYYVRSAIVYSNSKIEYGNIQSVTIPHFYLRKEGRLDEANVWNARWEYSVLDLVTDEVVDFRGKFIYSSNEDPTPKEIENPRGKIYNSCYKFANEWNYVLWLSHAPNLINEKDIVDEPLITQNGNVITMSCGANEVIHYEVNQEGITRPQNFSRTYSQPFKAKKGDIIKAYAQNTNTNFPSYTNVFVVQ